MLFGCHNIRSNNSRQSNAPRLTEGPDKRTILVSARLRIDVLGGLRHSSARRGRLRLRSQLQQPRRQAMSAAYVQTPRP